MCGEAHIRVAGLPCLSHHFYIIFTNPNVVTEVVNDPIRVLTEADCSL